MTMVDSGLKGLSRNHNIGIQIKRKESTKTFMMISDDYKLKKTAVSMVGFHRDISAL